MSLGRGWRGVEIDEEICHHLEEAVDQLVEEGWEPEAARREAERRFGNRARIRGELERVGARGERGGGFGAWIASCVSDLAHALRSAVANPTYTGSVVVTLALGLGAATTLFAVVDALLLRPLPYADIDRWVEVGHSDRGYSPGIAAERVEALRAASEGFADAWILFHTFDRLVRTDGDLAEALDVAAVTPGAARLLDVPIILGRGLEPEDGRPGTPPVAVLGHAYWTRTGSDPGILGRTIRTEAGPVTVVGVRRAGPPFPPLGPDPDLWVPLREDLTWLDRTLGWVDGVWLRLAPGAPVVMAQERLDAFGAALSEQGGEEETSKTWKVALRPIGFFRADLDVRRVVSTLGWTVIGIFLIALVNSVNLVLVRTSGRARELAVRGAVGASRRRIVRQLLVEGSVLSGVGGGAAALVAVEALAGVRAVFPTWALSLSPYAFTVEGRTLGFLALATLASGAVLGGIPSAAVVGRQKALAALSGRADGGGRAVRRFRQGLVVAQVAVTMTLLIVAGLLTRGMRRLLAVDPGYDYEHVASAVLVPSDTRYGDAAARAELARRLEEALEAQPEVRGATVVSDGGFARWRLQAEGADAPPDQPSLVPTASVAPDYFATVGARLTAGRALSASDAGTDNVVVDRDLARFLWRDVSPIGRRFRADESRWMTVVGVVRELRLLGRDQRRGPYQFLRARPPGRMGGYFEVLMRTSGDPEELLPLFRRTLRSLDAEQWIYKLRSGSRALEEEEETPRFLLTVMALLASLATALSAVGLYGVLAYSVERRRKEFGVRTALGARGAAVLRDVVGEGLRIVLVGVALGLVGAFGLSRVIAALLYEVDPHDAASWGTTVALLLGVSVVAAWLPARRATEADPAEVLRVD